LSFSKFSNLIADLGQTTKTNDKLALLKAYFTTAPDADKVWTIALFTGRRPRRLVSGNLMGLWCMELSGLPGWLFTECYGMVGDLSETIALLLEPAADKDISATNELTLTELLNQLQALQSTTEDERKTFVLQCWRGFTAQERFVFNKLMSANFRVGVSANLPIQALAVSFGLSVAEVAHRISGKWDPAQTTFHDLLISTTLSTDNSKPYPFYLAYPLEDEISSLGHPDAWQAEWKWDGIRGQVIKRNGEGFIWSRGEELITEKFPEFQRLLLALPNGICVDGEIISLPAGYATLPHFAPAPFGELQKRIGRKNLTKKILGDVPAGFIAYDILEFEGKDIRETPMEERRKILEQLFSTMNDKAFSLSATIEVNDWEKLIEIRTQSREMGAEGLMLKRKKSPYGTGRRRGDWWKWKIDPLSIDAVLIYAQKGSGRRSNLYTDYTFAVRDGEKLVPFAKAYSGLTDKEFAQVDAFIKRNAIEKFGPVRTVKPELVFEIGFEGISASTRHKSGVALRFPRMLRWRTDKKLDEINTLDELKAMLEAYGKKLV
jgi:DNA ligase-1